MSIKSLFYPRGVAVVGSTSEGKIGWELIRQMLDGGYERIFAVNPKAQGAFGVPGYDAVTKIEQPVDMAVIVSPPATVPGVLEDCGRAGVRAAVVITAGFSEVGNDAGEVEIKRVADRHGSASSAPTAPASSTPPTTSTPRWRPTRRPGAWPSSRRAARWAAC